MTEWQQRILRNIVEPHNVEKILGENLELFSRTIEQKGNIISLIFMAEQMLIANRNIITINDIIKIISRCLEYLFHKRIFHLS